MRLPLVQIRHKKVRPLFLDTAVRCRYCVTDTGKSKSDATAMKMQRPPSLHASILLVLLHVGVADEIKNDAEDEGASKKQNEVQGGESDDGEIEGSDEENHVSGSTLAAAPAPCAWSMCIGGAACSLMQPGLLPHSFRRCNGPDCGSMS